MIRFNCYQCDKFRYLFADSRCADCTRLTPEEVRGDIVEHDEDLHKESEQRTD